MTISFNLGSSPWWATFNLTGLSNGGGKLFSYSSLNPSVPKPIFQTPDGSEAYPNPVLIPLNGQLPPMYFQFDTNAPDDNYFLILTDKDENTIDEIDNYSGASGGGGGGSVTEVINLNNLVLNNVFWRNVGTISNSSTPALANGTVLAPSSHSAFVFPDTTFVLTGTCGQTISFPASSSVVTPPVLTGDVVPEVIFRYEGLAGGTDSVKQIRIPISPHIATLVGQQLTFSMWAQTDTVATINVRLLQYAGTGGSPVNAETVIKGPTALSATWTRLTGTITVPAFVPGNLGTNGNDGNYIIINLPLQQITQVNLTKPSIYIGNKFTTSEFLNYDQIDSTINTPRTGDLKITYGPAANLLGWYPMNDTTIGSSMSGSTRANNDTYYLYVAVWNATNAAYTANHAYMPIFTSGGAPTTRGGSADADFTANKRLQLPYTLGAVMANAGAPNAAAFGNLAGVTWVSGQPDGGERSLLDHQHPNQAGTAYVYRLDTGGGIYGTGAPKNGGQSDPNTGPQGNTVANTFNNVTFGPTQRANYYLKL